MLSTLLHVVKLSTSLTWPNQFEQTLNVLSDNMNILVIESP